MPNWTVTVPFVDVSRDVDGKSRWKAWNWEAPAVERLAAPVSMMMP
jgi:hypothetical protein